MVARKTTSFCIPVVFSRFGDKKISLERFVELAAAEYELKDISMASQLKRILPEIKSVRTESGLLQHIVEIYKKHFDALTTPAKIIVSSICANQGQKKLNWLLKQSSDTDRIKKTESHVKEALRNERSAATTYFLDSQKDFLNRVLSEDINALNNRDIQNLESALDKNFKETVDKKRISKLDEFVIESPYFNFMEKFYELYDRLQERHWIKGNKSGSKSANAKNVTLLAKKVSFPKNFQNYYYKYAKTMQRLVECLSDKSQKQSLLENCADFLERASHIDSRFTHLALGDIYINLARLAEKSKAWFYLDKASDAYHTALKEKVIKFSNRGVVSSKLGNCHIGKLKLSRGKEIDEKFIDYLKALKHLSQAHHVMNKLEISKDTLSEYKRKLGATLFHLGKDLAKSGEPNFRKISDLLRFYDPTAGESIESASDTITRRVKSVMIPKKYSTSKKELLLLRIFVHAKNTLKESQIRQRGFYNSLKIDEQIARCFLHIGRLRQKMGSLTLVTNKHFDKARVIFEDIIDKINKKESNDKKRMHKLSLYYNFLGEAYARISRKGNVLDRIDNKIKSIDSYVKTIRLKKELNAEAHPACYSFCATNYINIADIILDARVSSELGNISARLGIEDPDKLGVASECYTRAIRRLNKARTRGDDTINCTTKIGGCYYQLAKLRILKLDEIEKRLRNDLNSGKDITDGVLELFSPGGGMSYIKKSIAEYQDDYDCVNPDNVDECDLVWNNFYKKLKQYFKGQKGKLWQIEKAINVYLKKAVGELDCAIAKDKELGNEDDLYILPFWLKADLASYFSRQKHRIDIENSIINNPEDAWAEFLIKSNRHYFRNITNCRVWRADGRGASKVNAIFKSPVDPAQSLRLEKILIESLGNYEVKQLLTKDYLKKYFGLDHNEILILQAKGTKTLNELICESIDAIQTPEEGEYFCDEVLRLYFDAVSVMVKNNYKIKELHTHGALHGKAKKEGFNLDDHVITFTLEDYYDFTDTAIDALDLKMDSYTKSPDELTKEDYGSLRFGLCNLPNNTCIGEDKEGNDVFVSYGDQYTAEHLKIMMREISKECIEPMKEGFDFDPNSDNVMVYDDEAVTRVECGIDFEKLKIRKYIAGLCMFMFYANPMLPDESGEKSRNFLIPERRKKIIDHFIVNELKAENLGSPITIDDITFDERYQCHRDVTMYEPLRRIGLAGNEKRKLLGDKKLRILGPKSDRQLSKEEIDLLKKRIFEGTDHLKESVAYAIDAREQKDLGRLYGKDKNYFVILNDIISDMKIIL